MIYDIYIYIYIYMQYSIGGKTNWGKTLEVLCQEVLKETREVFQLRSVCKAKVPSHLSRQGKEGSNVKRACSHGLHGMQSTYIYIYIET